MKKYMLIEVNTFGFTNVTFYDADGLDLADEYGEQLAAADMITHAELYSYQGAAGYYIIKRWK